MNNKKKIMGLLIVVLSIVQSQAAITMKSYTINSGGGETMKGGTFEMNSSIGQVDATDQLSSGSFELRGGFWNSKPKSGNGVIFKDSFED